MNNHEVTRASFYEVTYRYHLIGKTVAESVDRTGFRRAVTMDAAMTLAQNINKAAAGMLSEDESDALAAEIIPGPGYFVSADVALVNVEREFIALPELVPEEAEAPALSF